jgi:hypothetical protein
MTKATLLIALGSSQLFGADVEVITKNDWGSGFCADVIVSNNSDIKEKWNISFNPQGLITKLWSANYTQDKTTLLTTASGVSWNAYIQPNSTQKFGYCANRVALAPVPPLDGDLEVIQTQKEAWDGGFCNRVEVKNLTTHSIDWEVTFPVEGEVTSIWNATYVQDNSTLLMVSNGLDWNNVIKANELVSFGYCANSSTATPPSPPSIDINNSVSTANLDIFNSFNVGFGGAYAIPFASTVEGEKIWMSSVNLTTDEGIGMNSYYSGIKNFNPTAFSSLQQSLKKSKFLVYWFTEGWDESWFNATKIQTAMDAGYIPVFNYWYFGDKLDGIPTTQEQEAYKADNQRIVTFLNKLNGTKFLIMEPEFNKNEILISETTQHDFASIIGTAIDTIKADTKDVYFSLAMTDTGSRGVSSTYEKCGYTTCALGDKYEWGKPSIVYNDLIHKLDFISFQEMLAQFSRDPSNSGTWTNPIPISYSNDDTGIEFLAERISNFALFLKEKYNKPVFLPYISIATASWSDSNNNQAIEESEIDYSGWEREADNAYQSLSAMKSTLQANGLFGFALMSLFDNPQHDVGGYQYFMQNEYHLGVLKSSAIDAVDIASYGDIVPKGTIINSVFDTP